MDQEVYKASHRALGDALAARLLGPRSVPFDRTPAGGDPSQRGLLDAWSGRAAADGKTCRVPLNAEERTVCLPDPCLRSFGVLCFCQNCFVMTHAQQLHRVHLLPASGCLRDATSDRQVFA